MNPKGKTVLKVTGFLLALGGLFGAMVAVVTLLSAAITPGMLSLSTTLGTPGNPSPEAVFVMLSAISLIGALLNLLAGFFGIKYCTEPSNVDKCIKIGICLILYQITSTMATVPTALDTGAQQGDLLVSFALSLIVPGIYTASAVMVHKSMLGSK